jgi:hypothetical protein
MGSGQSGSEPTHSPVSFSEAVTVLEDEFGLTREDPDALEESRFVTLGLSNLGNLQSACRGLRLPRAGYHPSNFSLEGEQTPEGIL